MQELHSSAAIWIFAIVQLFGWIGGLCARFSTGSRHQSVCHTLFMLALVIVGFSTCMSLFLGSLCWLLSAATLCSMILLAICDFNRHARPATI